jgi:hypothetical protein
MALREKNLDIYGKGPIPWSRAVAQLEQREFSGGRGTSWLSTTCLDRRPHAAGVLGVWLQDTLFFISGPRTSKSRNFAAHPGCAVSASLPDLDVVLEGTATRVTDSATLRRVADAFAARGWPATVDGANITAPFGAPSAGSPPWHLFAATPITAFGVATAGAEGAMRWRFP